LTGFTIMVAIGNPAIVSTSSGTESESGASISKPLNSLFSFSSRLYLSDVVRFSSEASTLNPIEMISKNMAIVLVSEC